MTALRVVVAPDSFKGSVSARRAATAIAAGWSAVRPTDELTLLPMADGGEGTLDAVAAASPGAVLHTLQVPGPDSRPVQARWLMREDGVAVVELAQSSGLPLLARPDPLGSHTRGLGMTMAAAMDAGASQVLVGLGGSASTDGGTGCLVALGARFVDAAGRSLTPGGAALADLAHVDLSHLRPLPRDGVHCLSDVAAPLLGTDGAAAVFGPQKGATPTHVALLDHGLSRLESCLGIAGDQPGDGAAGGTGYGLRAVLGATVEPGAAAITELSGLARIAADADLLVTGEGRFDATSLTGKVVGYLADLVRGEPTRLAVVAGAVDDLVAEQVGLHDALSLSDLAGGAAAARAEPEAWLRVAGARLASGYP